VVAIIRIALLVLIGGSGAIETVAGYDSGGGGGGGGGTGLRGGHPDLIVSYRGFGVGSRSGSTMFRLNCLLLEW